jgi:thiamine biosynthesis lipoprotein
MQPRSKSCRNRGTTTLRLLVPRVAPPAAANPRGALRALGGPTMGTTWSVKLVAEQACDIGALRRGVEACLARVVAEMSTWQPDSAISRFNRAPAGSWHALPEAFFAVLDHALALARATEGAYDPTLGALVDLWGFGPKGRRDTPPPGEAIEAARRSGGWSRVVLDKAARRARQPGGLALDLSSIAKGYAVDLLAEYLLAAGVDSFLVEIGGELRGQGLKPDGSPWLVALENPGAAMPVTVAALHRRSVATSGDYRRFFARNGRRYAHTIDPRTGCPLANGVASVTVLHRRCMEADALATALSVLGAERGVDFARRNHVAARLVIRGARGLEERTSPEFDAMLD